MLPRVVVDHMVPLKRQDSVTKSNGRPHGTTQEAGYSVTKRNGRPRGTTQEAGYSVTKSSGRPHGTTQEAGYTATKSCSRPYGATVNEGYNVGGQARPNSMKSELARFSNQDSKF